MPNILAKSLSAALLVAGVAASQHAAADGATLNISAVVNNNCIVSTNPIAFGSYDPIVSHAATALDGTGTVNVTCTNGAPATVALDEGSHSTGSGSIPQRRMSNGAASFLGYQLYQDPGRGEVWGADEGLEVAIMGTGLTQSLVVFGQVPAGQNVPAGNYSDTVFVTVAF
jgi:spore coat protein U-like protein